jgi:hypothetical protein
MDEQTMHWLSYRRSNYTLQGNGTAATRRAF